MSAADVATAVLLATECAKAALEGERQTIATDDPTPLYATRPQEFAWLDRVSVAYADTEPDYTTMARLREITDAVPFDAAAVAPLNAAQWIVREYERAKRMH